jgi:hypothetical protein
MKKWFTVLFIQFCVFEGFLAQSKGLILGRNFPLPEIDSSVQLQYATSFPNDSLKIYDFILIFSSSNSNLNNGNIAEIQSYVNQGGNLYLGADNWPFVEESNQLTQVFFGKRYWGNQQLNNDLMIEKKRLKDVTDNNQDFALQSTVTFPMDYRLKVEVWTGDEPLILSGNFGKGKVILDGGYARFNLALNQSGESKQIFNELIQFLVK